MENGYNYMVIVDNNEQLKSLSTLLENKYNKRAKYAMRLMIAHKDGSENVSAIMYSNDLGAFQKQANEFVSWYNYPIGLYKPLDGIIRKLP